MLESYKTKLVLFDLDGTLIDTAPDFLISLNNVLTKHGKEKIGLAQIRPHISEGSSKMIKFFFQIDYDHKNFEMYKNEFLSEYKLNLIKNSKLFNGMDDVIEFLDNNSIMYGIVTNKFHEYAEPIVESFSELKNI
jgi:phosphoglycolate phosphatase